MDTPHRDVQNLVQYVLSSATADDLERIVTATKTRRRSLRDIAAAKVTVGAAVTLQDLSPKYLNGLRGTVKSIRGNRATVTLDETSTNNLGFAADKFCHLTTLTTYDLTGIPLSSCDIHAG